MFPNSDSENADDMSRKLYLIGETKTRMIFFLGIGSIVFMIIVGSGLFLALGALGVAWNVRTKHKDVLLVERNITFYRRGVLLAKISLAIFAFLLLYQFSISFLQTGVI